LVDPTTPSDRPVVVVGAHVQGLFLDVDSVPREGETVLGTSLDEPLDGGKSTNQAVAAVRLGAPTALVTVVGTDARGERALEFFAAEGIDVRGSVRSDGPTDIGFILLPPSRIPAIVSVLDRSYELDAVCIREASSLIQSGSVVVCALEASQETALEAFRLAREVGARTILNPAPARELAPELLAVTDILVPNEHEASFLAGRNDSPADLAARLCRDFAVRAVIVTAGAAGAFVVEKGGTVEHVVAPVVTAVDTTGAGDAFVGALASRLRLGWPMIDSVAFGVRAASIAVTRPGTMHAFPTAGELAGETEPNAKSRHAR
jgi:ribokinase